MEWWEPDPWWRGRGPGGRRRLRTRGRRWGLSRRRRGREHVDHPLSSSSQTLINLVTLLVYPQVAKGGVQKYLLCKYFDPNHHHWQNWQNVSTGKHKNWKNWMEKNYFFKLNGFLGPHPPVNGKVHWFKEEIFLKPSLTQTNGSSAIRPFSTFESLIFNSWIFAEIFSLFFPCAKHSEDFLDKTSLTCGVS